MLIDWFTVGAQAMNFLILVWLLQRFLYKPVLNAIAVREKRIAAELADAAAKQADASKERDAFQRKNEAFDAARTALLAKATDDANAERERLLDTAKQAADALSTQRGDALRNEATRLSQAVTRTTQDEVFAIARKALADLASVSLEAQMVDVFERRLRALDTEAKASIAAALSSGSTPALVRSAFDLPGEACAAIQHALNETFGKTVAVRFETAPELISGIEFSANGQKVAWSIGDYLTSLDAGVRALLDKRSQPAASP